MRRFILVFLTLLAVAGTAVAGFSFAGVVSGTSPVAVGRAAVTTNVDVQAGEYYFKLSPSTAPVGTVVFTVRNVGTEVHDFSIAGHTTPTISPGTSATLTVNFSQPGPYGYACNIGEHAELGMEGSYTITGATQTTTATTVITTGGTTRTVTTTATTTATTPPPPKPTATVKVSEKEFKIALPSTTKKVAVYKRVKGKRVKTFKKVVTVKPVRHGLVRFVVKNVGKIGHNFVIAGHQTLVIKPGKTSSIDVPLKKGKYKYLCSIQGHAALGMRGTLTVT
jgi:uncharacterized cupredoxin-like copper-binding protein